MRRAISWFAENSVAANLLMVIVLAAGIVGLPSIKQQTFPDIDVNLIQIGVPYLGASPSEVEEGVCIRLEEELQGVDGIEQMTSSSVEGACGVTLEIITGHPVDRALAEIKNAVDSISTFPAETEKPIVNHLAMRRNTLQIALSGNASERALRIYGEKIREGILSLPEVTQVDLSSVRAYEISIEVSESSLRRYGLTFDEVARAIRRSSLDLPGGAIKTSSGEILLRAKGQAYSGEEYENIVVRSGADGTRLKLGDVATVIDGFEDNERSATFGGEPAVMIGVYRVGDQKVLNLARSVKEKLVQLRAQLPEALSLTVWRDDSSYLKDRLSILLRNAYGGFALVFVLLALFLRLRLALWVALGVPVSVMGALSVFPVFDFSIDVLTLFAFIMVLGLLVDDAIVVGENIYTHQEMGKDPLLSAIVGTQEVSVPVIFGVLTTVVAFLPMITAPGSMGQFFGMIGLVVVIALFFSVVESQLVLPAHLGHHAGKYINPAEALENQTKWKKLQSTLSGSLVQLARRGYLPALRKALEWRYATLAIAISLLMVALATVGTGRVRWTFFPPVEGDYISAMVTMPLGTPFEQTAKAVKVLEDSFRAVNADLDAQFGEKGSTSKHVMAMVGGRIGASRGDPSAMSSSGGASNVGEVSVELVGGAARKITPKEVVSLWRSRTPGILEADEVLFVSDYFSFGDPVDIRLNASNVEQLELAAEWLKQKLAEYPGVFDVSDSFQGGKSEIRLAIRPSAEALGLSLEDLARQVRQAFYGEQAQRIQRERDDIRVMVRYPQAERGSLADLENLRIRTPDGGEVPFYAVATATTARGYATIKRVDRERTINVIADVDESRGNAEEIFSDLRAKVLPELTAQYPAVAHAMEGEQRRQGEMFASLGRTYMLAMILIYTLLAIPLRSYGQPLIIMAVIPFGLVGAIGGHILMGLNLSMMSTFGAVALSGVVVNSSLVLVHSINRRRKSGSSIQQAVCEAGTARFRPIVLTSLTTFAGLGPLLFEKSMGAQFVIPMGVSLAFGVVFATTISLFLVPCGYLILEDLKRFFSSGGGVPLEEPNSAAPLRLQPPLAEAVDGAGGR
ncbi:MAG TPA: efflux RND transporter permease subunit [Myxococcales bacterium]|nr:efflux RND transporter permease subunit [Myxococcales bacterium]